MSDLYTELLVKREKRFTDSLIKVGLITLTVLFVLAGLLLNPVILLGALALGILDYFIIPKTSLEYEYLFVNGEFDIDVIMSQQKRKRVCSFNLNECDIAAPEKSHRMDYFNNNQKLKVPVTVHVLSCKCSQGKAESWKLKTVEFKKPKYIKKTKNRRKRKCLMKSKSMR